MVSFLTAIKALNNRSVLLRARKVAGPALEAAMWSLPSFASAVGTRPFLTSVFPLLANPALLSPLVFLLRAEPGGVPGPVLSQCVKSLLSARQQDLSEKALNAVVQTLGEVVCFTAEQGQATNVRCRPFLNEILLTLTATLDKHPYTMGRLSCSAA